MEGPAVDKIGVVEEMYCRASAMESIKSCFLMMLISSSLVLVVACASKASI